MSSYLAFKSLIASYSKKQKKINKKRREFIALHLALSQKEKRDGKETKTGRET